MNRAGASHAAAGARARAQQLAAWWRGEPDNPALLEAAVEAACSAGDADGARSLLREAGAAGLPAAAAGVLQARIALGEGDAATADTLLLAAAAAGADPALVAHERGCAAWLRGDLPACQALAAPWATPDASAGPYRDALQTLWLRAAHAAGEIASGFERACALSAQWGPQAAGVGSLLALDADAPGPAQAWANQSLQSEEPPPEALVTCGTLALGHGDTTAAQGWLEQALAQRPGDGRVLGALGLLALAQQRPGEAVALLTQAVRRLPQHVGGWHALGWASLLCGDLAGARQAFAQATAVDPAFAESHGALGLCAALAGDRAAAVRHLRVARGLDRAQVTGAFAAAVLRGTAGPAALEALVQRVLGGRTALDGSNMAARVLQQARRAADARRSQA